MTVTSNVTATALERKIAPTSRPPQTGNVPSISPGSARPTRKLRVVHVAQGTSMGGMEKLLVEFARFTTRSDFELAFLSLQAKGPLATKIEKLDWPVHSFGKTEGAKPTLVLRLASQLRNLQADVVHTHNAGGFVYGVAAAKLAGVGGIIHTQHGRRFASSARGEQLFRWLSKFADRVIGVSEDVQQLLISRGIDHRRTGLIRNGVDREHFRYAGPHPQGPALLVARLSPEKDIATLIHAMKRIEQLYGSQPDRLRLEIVGDGVCRSQLETLTRTLALSDTVRFLGERDDVASLLGKASMFVLPSLTEGISLTLLEAMARGLPVVATRVGGNREVVVNDQTGWLVPAQDSVAMAEAMVRLHQRPELGLEMGRLGRRRVEQCFSIERMIQAYEQLYVQSAMK